MPSVSLDSIEVVARAGTPNATDDDLLAAHGLLDAAGAPHDGGHRLGFVRAAVELLDKINGDEAQEAEPEAEPAQDTDEQAAEPEAKQPTAPAEQETPTPEQPTPKPATAKPAVKPVTAKPAAKPAPAKR